MNPTKDKDQDGHAGSVSRTGRRPGRMLAALTRPLSTTEFFGQVLTAIAEQLGSEFPLCSSTTRPSTLSRSTPVKVWGGKDLEH